MLAGDGEDRANFRTQPAVDAVERLAQILVAQYARNAVVVQQDGDFYVIQRVIAL